MYKKAALLLCVLTLPLMAHAKVYTYKDASGRTVYSDVPPPTKTPAKEVTVKVAPAKEVTAPETEKNPSDSLADQQAELNKKIAENNKKIEEENKRKREEDKKANCEAARLNLQTVQSGRVVNKETLMQKYQNDIDTYCK
ncbi:DUF4124 domain-containing protein [Neisseria sp. Ec49-e6-T10]|uniref:DUF4124 domain-containing protein n=1 Tax=Neisseria sp. Ec49-e6-T10 TaxID=3140744 RepID=UPI003EB9679C